MSALIGALPLALAWLGVGVAPAARYHDSSAAYSYRTSCRCTPCRSKPGKPNVNRDGLEAGRERRKEAVVTDGVEYELVR
jgi:hypothetical protein